MDNPVPLQHIYIYMHAVELKTVHFLPFLVLKTGPFFVFLFFLFLKISFSLQKEEELKKKEEKESKEMTHF